MNKSSENSNKYALKIFQLQAYPFLFWFSNSQKHPKLWRKTAKKRLVQMTSNQAKIISFIEIYNLDTYGEFFFILTGLMNRCFSPRISHQIEHHHCTHTHIGKFLVRFVFPNQYYLPQQSHVVNGQSLCTILYSVNLLIYSWY